VPEIRTDENGWTLCDATTTKGKPCRQRVVRGKTTCPAHTPEISVGRRTELTPEVHAAIVGAIAKGATITDAAEAAGIHRDSVSNWNRRGRADFEAGNLETDHARFFRDSMRAKAEARQVALESVRNAMATDWRAGAWYLERSAPADYGRADRLAVTAHVETTTDGPDLSKLSDDELAQMERLLAKAGQDAGGD
jgi:hypothetical protein